jgi:hypothetical protein
MKVHVLFFTCFALRQSSTAALKQSDTKLGVGFIHHPAGRHDHHHGGLFKKLRSLRQARRALTADLAELERAQPAPVADRKAKLLAMRMRELTMQCSHNTYLWGVQSGAPMGTQVSDSADPLAYKIALGLGYRCIEIDIWPGNEKEKTVFTGYTTGKTIPDDPVKVAHRMLGSGAKSMSNSIPLATRNLGSLGIYTGVLETIRDWMDADEAADTTVDLRTPIIISVENHADTAARLKWMATQFTRVFGTRLVQNSDGATGPDSFHAQTLATFSSKIRKVIIKSDPKADKSVSTDQGAPNDGETHNDWSRRSAFELCASPLRVGTAVCGSRASVASVRTHILTPAQSASST